MVYIILSMFNLLIFSVDERYAKSEWQDLHVGDFVHLSCNEIIPADIVLLKSSDVLGICHIETSNLDGETNLKQRQVVSGLNYTVRCHFLLLYLPTFVVTLI